MLSAETKKRIWSYYLEDLGSGDVTSQITPSQNCKAEIFVNEDCTIAGIEETIFLLRKLGLNAKSDLKDGAQIKGCRRLISIFGQNRKILSAERICLNILGRMSGVATICSLAKRKMGRSRSSLAVTRKTVPGFQMLDKLAAEIGGAWTHRKNLSEMILLKENHLRFFSSALDAADRAKKTGKKFEIEVENEWDAIAASLAQPDIIMLDNFKPAQAKQTIGTLKKFGFKGKIELSGGITIKTLGKYSNLGADIISMGELTKGAKIMDFSLDIAEVKK